MAVLNDNVLYLKHSLNARALDALRGEATALEGKVDALIKQLRSPNEKVRVQASKSLAGMGKDLNKAQVNKIVGIMRTGNEKWRKFLRRESHCTWYEQTSVKYYAAGSVSNMKSSYVTREIQREAAGIKKKSRRNVRVTDPGWI